MQLGGGDQQQRPEGGLVHGRQGDAEHDDEDQHLVQARLAARRPARLTVPAGRRSAPDASSRCGDAASPAPAAGVVHSVFSSVVRTAGRNSMQQHGRIGHDAERHLEHGRVGLPLGGDEEIIGVPGAPHVDHDREAGQAVAEHAGQNGRADHRVVVHVVADVDQDRHGVAAAGDGRAGGHVVGDPDPPGIAVAHVGDRTDPLDEADRNQGEADQGQGQQDEEGRGQDLGVMLSDIRRGPLCFSLASVFRPSSCDARLAPSCS